MSETLEAQTRGKLTTRIKEKSIELFGYEISQKELRLMPFIIYSAQNNRKINFKQTNDEEDDILLEWVDKDFITIGSGGELTVTYDFFMKANELIYLGYVEIT